MLKFLFLFIIVFIAPAHAEISANMKRGGMVIGPAGDAECVAGTEGALRWNSSDKAHEMCSGTAWQKIFVAKNSGDASSPQAGTGYFVLTHDKWNGDLAGLAGADAKCLSDLTNYNWLNKADATSRGLINGTKIKAFLCGGACQNANNTTTYTFAVAGAPTIGGARFTTNGSGQGPGNTQNWSGTNYFGTAAEYWTGRASASATLWGAANNTCTTWSVSSNAGTATFGTANGTDGSRWRLGTNTTCDLVKHLICLVHP